MSPENGHAEYSERLGRISDEQFQAALDRFELGKFLGAEPVTDGLFGQNVFVDSTSGRYVLRGCPHYPKQFRQEQFHAKMLHERTTVPVPWPYLVEDDDALFGWSYVVMPRMPGISTRRDEFREGMSRDDAIGIARALATTLVEMQKLTWDCAGTYDPDTGSVEPFEQPFAERIVADIQASLELSRETNDRTTDDDIKWSAAIVEANRHALEGGAPFSPCYVFHDYREGNMVLQEFAGEWRVSGLFDLMEGFFGDGEVDLSRASAIFGGDGPDVFRAFIDTYLELRPPREGFAERFRVYMLEDCLTIWSYFQKHDAPWIRKYTSLRDFAEKSVMLPGSVWRDRRALRTRVPSPLVGEGQDGG